MSSGLDLRFLGNPLLGSLVLCEEQKLGRVSLVEGLLSVQRHQVSDDLDFQAEEEHVLVQLDSLVSLGNDGDEEIEHDDEVEEGCQNEDNYRKAAFVLDQDHVWLAHRHD